MRVCRHLSQMRQSLRSSQQQDTRQRREERDFQVVCHEAHSIHQGERWVHLSRHTSILVLWRADLYPYSIFTSIPRLSDVESGVYVLQIFLLCASSAGLRPPPLGPLRCLGHDPWMSGIRVPEVKTSILMIFGPRISMTQNHRFYGCCLLQGLYQRVNLRRIYRPSIADHTSTKTAKITDFRTSGGSYMTMRNVYGHSAWRAYVELPQ